MAIFTGDDYTDLFMWDFAKCSDYKIPDSRSNDGLLLRTVTGHNGLVHSIQCTLSGLITCDVTGLIIERDFWACIEVSLLRLQKTFEGTIYCGSIYILLHVHSLILRQYWEGPGEIYFVAR